MIVTRIGHIPEDYMEIECPICGTEMLIDERDIKLDIIKSKMAILMQPVVECPVCGMKITLDDCVDVSM